MREPKLIIATGTKGVGKTHTTCGVIEKYIQYNPATGKEGRKVLIYDVNEEYTNEEIRKKGFNFITKTLSIKDLYKWTQQRNPEVRRILPRDEKGNLLSADQMCDLLGQILHTYRGGMLLLEDINAYLIGTNSKDIIGTMTRNRHKDLDIYIHLQSLSPVTPRMWQNCAIVRFHKQIDNIHRYKHRIPNVELYLIAEKLVDLKYDNGDKRFFVYIDNEYNKITGKFSLKQFRVAAYSYLLDNPQMISSAQKRFGTSMEAREMAIKYLIRDLQKYFGNEIKLAA